MTWNSLPPAARWYVLFVIALGLATMAALFHARLPRVDLMLAGAMLVGAITASQKIILIESSGAAQRAHQVSTMSLGFPVVLGALVHLGVEEGILVALFTALGGSLYPKPQPCHRTLFSLASLGLAAVASGAAIRVFDLSPSAVISVAGIPAFLTATFLYWLVNTGTVAIALAWSRQARAVEVWKEHFLWTWPGFLAGGTIVGGGLALSARFGVGFAALSLFCLYLVHHSYRSYIRQVHQLRESKRRMEETYLATVESLAMAIDARDGATSIHIHKVQDLALALAERAGITADELQAVRVAALVHDIGNMAVPDHILFKPGALTDEEFERVKTHVRIGADILDRVGFPWPVVPIVAAHHEHWDGSGYPNGLKADAIPVGARVLAIVDVFDALTSSRPYRRPMSREGALKFIFAHSGTRFDPRLVSLFVEDVGPTIKERPVTPPVAAAITPEGGDGGASSGLAGIRSASRETRALSELGLDLATAEDLDEAVRRVIARSRGVIDYSTAILFLLNEETGQLEAVGAGGRYAGSLTRVQLEPGEGVTGWAVQHLRAIVNGDPLRDLTRSEDQPESWELQSALSTPLIAGGAVIGALTLYHVHAAYYTMDHARLLTRVAEQSAPMLQNLRAWRSASLLALTDTLTGLGNGRYLRAELDRAFARARGSEQPLSLILADLDGFKAINDQYGHLKGDEALQIVARRLETLIRDGDRVFRYAGDEFVVLLPNTTREVAERVATRLQEGLDRCAIPGTPLCVGLSAGVANYPEDAADPRELIGAADLEMYRAKSRRKATAAQADR